jgi:acetoacetate decarboxylase
MKKNLIFLVALFCLVGLTFGQEQEKLEIPRGYSMPEAWPTFTTPPYAYENNEIAIITFKTSPEALRSLVPEPLTPNPMGMAIVYLGRLNITKPVALSYLEAGIIIPSIFKGKLGSYVTIMYLDKALPIIAGREIFGFAKKDAAITFSREGGKVSGRVTRDGIDLITLSVDGMERLEKIPTQPKIPWYTLKIIPSIIKGAPPDVKQLVSVPPGSQAKEYYSGKGNLVLKSSDLDPLGKIPILEILNIGFSVEDLILDHGEVLLDYLEEGGTTKKKSSTN